MKNKKKFFIIGGVSLFACLSIILSLIIVPKITGKNKIFPDFDGLMGEFDLSEEQSNIEETSDKENIFPDFDDPVGKIDSSEDISSAKETSAGKSSSDNSSGKTSSAEKSSSNKKSSAEEKTSDENRFSSENISPENSAWVSSSSNDYTDSSNDYTDSSNHYTDSSNDYTDSSNHYTEIQTQVEVKTIHTHNYDKWHTSKTSHWHECTSCKAMSGETAHIYSDSNDITCNVCGYERSLAVSQIKYKTNSSGYNYLTEIESHSDIEANEIKAKVYAEKNTEDIYNITGKKYYIDKNTPISDVTSKLNSGEIHSGDAVLFERGGIWRLPYKGWIYLPNGVIMGAYGTGEKPKFYGSRRNFADNSLWENMGGHIYRTHLKSSGNVGNMVFNNVACLGVKKWSLDEVKSNYDFYYSSDEYLYFYYSGNIENDFDSIEISQRGELINFKSNCIIDNICTKYTGSHGIDGAHGTENVKITNCEVGFIGGSMQSGTTRFGNGIEFPIGAKNITVKNNHIYQCYDAGLTFQSWSSAKKESHYYDIEFSENLIEKCCYGIEYFTTRGEKGTNSYSDYKNITFKNNVIRFSGYEWSQLQRPDPVMTSHIRGGQWAYVKDCENFTITDNIFDISRASIIFWWWNSKRNNFIHPEPHNGLTVKNNTYYQAKTPDKRIITYHDQDPLYATSASEFETAVRKFDSAPKKMVWLENLKLK